MSTALSPALHSNDSGSVRGVVLGLGMTPGLGSYWESLAPCGEGCKGSHCPPPLPRLSPFPASQTEAHLECLWLGLPSSGAPGSRCNHSTHWTVCNPTAWPPSRGSLPAREG